MAFSLALVDFDGTLADSMPYWLNGGQNAGILAAKILATSDAALLEKLEAYSEEMKDQVVEKDNRLQETGYQAY